MSTPGSSGQHLQKLRLQQSAGVALSQEPETVSIPAIWDPTTEEHIVLFHDIQLLFRDAVRIMNGTVLVSFDVDNNFQRYTIYPASELQIDSL